MTDQPTPNPTLPSGVQGQPIANGTPWNFGATLGLAFLAVAGYALAQLATLAYLVPDFAKMDQKALEANGDLLSFTTISSTIVICLLIVLFTWMRKGYPTRTYLGLFWPSWREFFFWLAVLVGSSVLILGLYYMLGLPMTSQTMINLYKSTNYAALFWITVVIAAPLSEEFFFRGFLLEGWRKSFLGVYGAVILTALFWGVIHTYPFNSGLV